MTTLAKFIPGLILLLALCGCSDAEDARKSDAPPPSPPQFSVASDPREFFADYWRDLSGERFLPRELQKMYVGRTPLPQTLALIREHDTVAFLEAYYTEDYIRSLRQRDEKELDSMDYQLKIMDVSREDAADVLLLAGSAPLEQKAQLLQGEVARRWEKLDEKTWQVTLSRDDWSQQLLLVEKGGSWELAVPAPSGAR